MEYNYPAAAILYNANVLYTVYQFNAKSIKKTYCILRGQVQYHNQVTLNLIKHCVRAFFKDPISLTS